MNNEDYMIKRINEAKTAAEELFKTLQTIKRSYSNQIK
jgi:hypothetical protein